MVDDGDRLMSHINLSHIPATDMLWTLSSTASSVSDMERQIHVMHHRLRQTRQLLGVVTEHVAAVFPDMAGPFGLL